MKSKLFYLLLLIGVCSVGYAGQSAHEVTLYGGSVKDPYTLYFPVEITEPGQIKVQFDISRSNPKLPKDDRPISAMLVDLRAFGSKKPMTASEWKKWLQKANKYNPAEYFVGEEIRHWVKSMKGLIKSALGKKKKRKIPDYIHRGMYYGDRGSIVKIKHAVDAPELSQYQGRYVLVVNNTSRSEVTQTITITTPGGEQEVSKPAKKKQRSDLVVKAIGKDKAGKLTVVIQNTGKAGVPERAYELSGKSAVTLIVKKNDKHWGGVTLPALDPKKKLMTPGARVRYTFNMDAPKNILVTAIIDASKKIKEINEKNNELSKTFNEPLKMKPMTKQVQQ